MITEQDLQEAIAECEGQRNPTANTCIKLAAYYTIKDKLYPEIREEREVHPMYSYARSADPSTEFRTAVDNAGIEMDELVDMMDELMSTIKIVVPRLYDGVMRKLTQR